MQPRSQVGYVASIEQLLLEARRSSYPLDRYPEMERSVYNLRQRWWSLDLQPTPEAEDDPYGGFFVGN